MMLGALPTVVENNLEWFVAGAIVVLGLLVYGFGDISQFSGGRAMAIAKVAFRESIRRRVLLITPLAIIGVMIVSSLQKASDEQDAIRQIVKFSLFAAGLVVTVTAIILACTNLPKEIETRVIYTIVTKPTTRLEIVVGKILGFSGVAAAILVIMGVFTMGYLHVRAWQLRSDIGHRLASGTVDPVSRPTLEYWQANGLLSARTFERPADMQIYAHELTGDETVRTFYGGGEGDILVPFRVEPEQLIPAGVPGATPGAAGVMVRLAIGFARSEHGTPDSAPPSNLPIGVAAPSDMATTAPGAAPKSAQVSVQVLDAGRNTIVDARQINQGQPITLTDPTGRQPVPVIIPPEAAVNLANAQNFYLNVTGTSGGVEYTVNVTANADPMSQPACIIVPGATPGSEKVIGPVGDPSKSTYTPLAPIFRRGMGTFGQQLRGGKVSSSPVAVFSFRDAEPVAPSGNVTIEMKTSIERSEDENQEDPTRVHVVVLNRATKTESKPTLVFPENNRTAYFTLPAESMKGGDFDVLVRNLNEGHYLGLQRVSMSMVQSAQSFDVNLIKSLAILWLLAVLVVIISVFCSTFLSWPIAIVLTVVILLGHWGVMQLGDSLAPGIGNQIATDLFGPNANASQSKVVSATVEALSRMLNNFAKVLPDISQFSAISDIEQGVTISGRALLNPLLVLATFGIPMIVLSYIFLRNKEVAP